MPVALHHHQLSAQVEPYMKNTYFNRKVVWTFTKWCALGVSSLNVVVLHL